MRRCEWHGCQKTRDAYTVTLLVACSFAVRHSHVTPHSVIYLHAHLFCILLQGILNKIENACSLHQIMYVNFENLDQPTIIL